MSKGFGFDLADSCRLARQVMARHVPAPPLDYWDAAVARWLAAKADLIAALDPKTGRATAVVPRPEPSAVDAWTGLLHACSYFGLQEFSGACSHDEALADAVAPNGRLLMSGAGVKPGMKLGRALVAYASMYYGPGQVFLNTEGVPFHEDLCERWRANNERKGRPQRPPAEEEFLGLVADEFARRRDRGREGTLVLSANPLDVLLMSVSASFSTCHRFGGEHQAGPQQYLYDDHTAVLYAYQEERHYPAAGVGLPYKLWRQLAHVCLPGRYASLMRQYPKNAPQALYQGATVGLLAAAFARHHGKDAGADGWRPGDYQVAPHLADPVAGGSAAKATAAAYVDLLGNLGPSVVAPGGTHGGFLLAPRPPCLCCGAPTLTSTYLICKECLAKAACPCCGGSYGEGRPMEVAPDGRRLCEPCVAKAFPRCPHCPARPGIALMRQVAGRIWVCQDCLPRNYAQCSCCETYVTKAQVDPRSPALGHRPICRPCFDRYYYACDGCHKVTTLDQTAVVDGPIRVCAACRDADYFLCPCCETHRKKAQRVEVGMPGKGSAACANCVARHYLACKGCGRHFRRNSVNTRPGAGGAQELTCKGCRDAAAREAGRKAQEVLLWSVTDTPAAAAPPAGGPAARPGPPWSPPWATSPAAGSRPSCPPRPRPTSPTRPSPRRPRTTD